MAPFSPQPEPYFLNPLRSHDNDHSHHHLPGSRHPHPRVVREQSIQLHHPIKHTMQQIQDKPPRNKARLLLLVTSALYASELSFVKKLNETVPVGISLVLRFGLASLMVLPLLFSGTGSLLFKGMKKWYIAGEEENVTISSEVRSWRQDCDSSDEESTYEVTRLGETRDCESTNLSRGESSSGDTREFIAPCPSQDFEKSHSSQTMTKRIPLSPILFTGLEIGFYNGIGLTANALLLSSGVASASELAFVGSLSTVFVPLLEYLIVPFFESMNCSLKYFCHGRLGTLRDLHAEKSEGKSRKVLKCHHIIGVVMAFVGIGLLESPCPKETVVLEQTGLGREYGSSFLSLEVHPTIKEKISDHSHPSLSEIPPEFNMTPPSYDSRLVGDSANNERRVSSSKVQHELIDAGVGENAYSSDSQNRDFDSVTDASFVDVNDTGTLSADFTATPTLSSTGHGRLLLEVSPENLQSINVSEVSTSNHSENLAADESRRGTEIDVGKDGHVSTSNSQPLEIMSIPSRHESHVLDEQIIRAQSWKKMQKLLCLVPPSMFALGFYKVDHAMARYPADAPRLTAAHIFGIFLVSLCFYVISYLSQSYLNNESFGLKMKVVDNNLSTEMHTDTVTAAQVFEWLTTPIILFQLLWSGIVSIVLGIYMEALAMKTLSASESVLIFSTEPVFASAIASYILGEAFLGGSLWGAFGAWLILIGCVVSEMGDVVNICGDRGCFKMSGLWLVWHCYHLRARFWKKELSEDNAVTIDGAFEIAGMTIPSSNSFPLVEEGDCHYTDVNRGVELSLTLENSVPSSLNSSASAALGQTTVNRPARQRRVVKESNM